MPISKPGLNISGPGLKSILDATIDEANKVPALVSDAAALDAAAVKKTGDQTVDGVKTFSSAPVVPNSSFTPAKVAGLPAKLTIVDALKTMKSTARVSSAPGTGFFDNDGVAGAPLTGYLPRRLTLQQDGNLLDFTNIGVASSAPGMSALTEIVFANGTTPRYVYFDMLDSTYKQVASAAADASVASQIPIGTFFGATFTPAGTINIMPISRVPVVAPQFPLVVEAGPTVLIPNISAFSNELGAGTAIHATDLFYKEVTDFGTLGEETIAVHFGKATAGVDPFDRMSYPKKPDRASMPIASGYRGVVSSPAGLKIIGDGYARVPNQVAGGKNNAATASILFGDSVVVDITDPTLIAMGFTKGVADLSGAASCNPFYGEVLPESRPGQHFNMRIYCQTSADNTFPAEVRGILRTLNSSGGMENVSFIALREKTLSVRAASFLVMGRYMGSNRVVGFIGGSFAGGGLTPVYCGAQAYYGPEYGWLARDEYPLIIADATSVPSPDPLFPENLCLIEGRPQAIYADGLLANEQQGSGVRVWVEGTKRGHGRFSNNPGGSEVIRIDGAELEGDCKLIVRSRDDGTGDYWERPLRVEAVTEAQCAGLAPIFLQLGDSTRGAAGKAVALVDKSVEVGMTPKSIGTTLGGAYTHARQTWCEGRPGKSAAAFTNQNFADTPNSMAIITSVDTYLGLSEASKYAYNPFLTDVISGVDPSAIFDGKTFDVRQYLTKFGFSDPTHVIIDLGPNDVIQYDAATSLSYVTNAVRIMGENIIAKLPNARIAFVTSPIGWSAVGNATYSERAAVNRAIIAGARALSNQKNVYVVPGHALLSREVGFYNPTTLATQADIGTIKRNRADNTHYVDSAIQQHAEAELAWVACTMRRDAGLENAVARMSSKPSQRWLNVIERMKDRLASDGILSKITQMGLLITEAANQSRKDIIGTADITVTGAPSWVALQGEATSSGNYHDTGIAASTLPTNSSAGGLVILTDDIDGFYDFGAPSFAISARGATGQLTTRHGALANDTVEVASSRGMFSISRLGSGGYDVYRNKTLLASHVRASTGMSTETIQIGRGNGLTANVQTRQYSLEWLSNVGWNATEIGKLWDAIEQMLIDFGALRQWVLRPMWTGATPAPGQTNVSRTPTFETTPFTTEFGKAAWAHKNSDWEVWTGPNGTGSLVWSSLADAVNKTLITVGTPLPATTLLYARPRHRPDTGDATAVSAYGIDRSFTTGA